MNKPGISAVAFVLGIGLMLVGALIAYALESMNVFSIREHLAERGQVYCRCCPTPPLA